MENTTIYKILAVVAFFVGLSLYITRNLKNYDMNNIYSILKQDVDKICDITGYKKKSDSDSDLEIVIDPNEKELNTK